MNKNTGVICDIGLHKRNQLRCNFVICLNLYRLQAEENKFAEAIHQISSAGRSLERSNYSSYCLAVYQFLPIDFHDTLALL
jgi:hypothetical protein